MEFRSKEFSGELRSTRLVLRRLRPEDAGALCAYRSLPEVARYQSWNSFTPDDAARLIEQQVSAQPGIPGTWFQLALVRINTGTLIGDCGLHCRIDDPRQMEIGITLAPDHQHSGFAAEAIGRVLEFVFEDLKKHRVTATVDALNAPAIALLQRLGFQREAHHVKNIWFKGDWGRRVRLRAAEGRMAPSSSRLDFIPPAGAIRADSRPAFSSAVARSGTDS